MSENNNHQGHRSISSLSSHLTQHQRKRTWQLVRSNNNSSFQPFWTSEFTHWRSCWLLEKKSMHDICSIHNTPKYNAPPLRREIISGFATCLFAENYKRLTRQWYKATGILSEHHECALNYTYFSFMFFLHNSDFFRFKKGSILFFFSLTVVSPKTQLFFYCMFYPVKGHD